jgi:hypothetical protein
MMDEESILGNPQQRRNSLNTAVPEFPEFTPYEDQIREVNPYEDVIELWNAVMRAWSNIPGPAEFDLDCDEVIDSYKNALAELERVLGEHIVVDTPQNFNPETPNTNPAEECNAEVTSQVQGDSTPPFRRPQLKNDEMVGQLENVHKGLRELMQRLRKEIKNSLLLESLPGDINARLGRLKDLLVHMRARTITLIEANKLWQKDASHRRKQAEARYPQIKAHVDKVEAYYTEMRRWKINDDFMGASMFLETFLADVQVLRNLIEGFVRLINPHIPAWTCDEVDSASRDSQSLELLQRAKEGTEP